MMHLQDEDGENSCPEDLKHWILLGGGQDRCGGMNPYTPTARLGPGDLAHHEDSSRLDPTARSFAQGNKTWRSSRILDG